MTQDTRDHLAALEHYMAQLERIIDRQSADLEQARAERRALCDLLSADPRTTAGMTLVEGVAAVLANRDAAVQAHVIELADLTTLRTLARAVCDCLARDDNNVTPDTAAALRQLEKAVRDELRALDAEIAVKLFGYTLDYEFADIADGPTVPELRDQYDEWGILPHYSTDMTDAWLVVEKMRTPDFRLNRDGDWVCCFGSTIAFCGEADSAPLAICRAALKAVGDV